MSPMEFRAGIERLGFVEDPDAIGCCHDAYKVFGEDFKINAWSDDAGAAVYLIGGNGDESTYLYNGSDFYRALRIIQAFILACQVAVEK